MNLNTPSTPEEKAIAKKAKQFEVKRLKLVSQLKELLAEQSVLRQACAHPERFITRVPKADRGNYDPTQDRYWYECRCDLCGLNWTIDNSLQSR